MPRFLLCVRPPVSSSLAPGPSWLCGSVSPTWLTRLCPNGLRAPWPFPSPPAEDEPRVGASWSCQLLSCAPPGWDWAGGSSLSWSGPGGLCQPRVSGPSTVRPAPASQRLPVCTAAGYGAAGMVCPGQSAPSCDSQPWHSGRARVCACAHALSV